MLILCKLPFDCFGSVHIIVKEICGVYDESRTVVWQISHEVCQKIGLEANRAYEIFWFYQSFQSEMFTKALSD